MLINEETGENPWGVSFLRMIDMANDSHLFHTESGPNRVPLYEAKMIHQFDHRFGTWEGVQERGNSQLPSPTPEQYADPSYTTKPWYWVDKDEVEARLGNWDRGWLMGFRDVTNATNERTVIASVLPRMGVGHTMPLIMVVKLLAGCLLANLNSVILDYIARQKIGGTHITFFIIKQLPILPPDRFTDKNIDFIIPRVCGTRVCGKRNETFCPRPRLSKAHPSSGMKTAGRYLGQSWTHTMDTFMGLLVRSCTIF